ncbi:MAG: hypothetical protein EOO46_18125 [Flavobacterium sp.]|nr:MAG: hypothetical protein EOO46_18125 [Flavobacterium sp.]
MKHFELTDTVFESRVSFNKVEVQTILIHLVNFGKLAYFDELKIKSLKRFKCIDIKNANEWRHTFRQIKQEFQKTDNKIDYNRFRSYELAAYYKELKWNTNFKDWFILSATKLATGFDHSWRRALIFCLIAGLLFYSLFYFSENYNYQFSLDKSKEFAAGYFRFLLVTDFYNPLSNGREYIQNDGWNHIISWFIFIFGKIVIAFGIYEMIQAFRKFKA